MTCPACRRTTISVPFADHSQCDRCGHIWQTDLAVRVNYAGEYGAMTYDTYPPTTAHLRAGLVLGVLGKREKDDILSVADIGYGNGSFLKVMKLAGYKTFGVDVHGKDYGITDISLGSALACGVITFFDSLEHFGDLSMIDYCTARHAFVSIPARPPWFRSNPHGWRHFKPGEHLHYFTIASLDALWRRAGMVISWHHHHEDVTRGHHPDPTKTHDWNWNIDCLHLVRP